MIRLSNGHELEYMLMSGALGYDGRGSWWQRRLATLGFIKPGLFTIVTSPITIKNIDWWCRNIGSSLEDSSLNIVPSLCGSREEILSMCERLDDFAVKAVAIDATAPDNNTQIIAGTVRKAKRRGTRHPLILRVSTHHKYLEVARKCGDNAEAIILETIDMEKLRMLRVSQNLPVVGIGISRLQDFEKLQYEGAEAFAFRNPVHATEMVEGQERRMTSLGRMVSEVQAEYARRKMKA